MDNLRVFLWVALAMMAWLLLQTWQQDYPATAGQPAADITAPASSPPSAAGRLPVLDAGKPENAGTPPAAPAAPAASSNAPPVHVRTDVFDLDISPAGAEISRVDLLQYPVHKDQPNVPVQLLSADPAHLFLLHSGLIAADAAAPNDLAMYSPEATEYVLEPGADELAVPFRWDSGSGVTVEKILHFRRGQYGIEVEYRVTNGSPAPYGAATYLQIERTYQKQERSYFDVDTYSARVPAAYDGTKWQKLDPEALAKEPFRQSVSGGWIAAIQHHFLAAAIPPASETFRYEGSFADGRYLLSAIGPVQTVAPGATASIQAKLFVGPKLQSQLAANAPGLPLTVDYGRLKVLAEPLFWILEKIHSLVGNWGWTIIFCTILIKLVFYKLTEMSGRSMARMRKLQPRLQALQERYKDDRQALSTALMDLYKREKVNPAAGCLPMLVQIPFFIAFYWVLVESVEMRQAPFLLWITDLSSRDPFFVLPLLMGAAMFIQQKLNPAPPDPVQAKVMTVMPVMFTVFFAFFPAGLVLYWLTNSVLSILQQWRINKVVGAE